MARYTGPKNKLSRREGLDLFGKGNKLRRATVPPGQHGPKGAKRLSDFGTQLREKQKTKRIYGIIERQFRKYFEKARKVRGTTGEILLRSLESRLDNVVYRLGFATNRNQARQLVTHGHVLVNGKVVDIPSYVVRQGETVTLDSKIANQEAVKTRLESPGLNLPAWLSRRATVGVISASPKRAEIDTAVNEQLIVEYYSNK
jgi:small subunit ribosomal protein S4